MNQNGAILAVQVDHRGALGTDGVHQRIERRLHHARRQHLLAHAPQDMVQDFPAAQRRRHPALVSVVFGPVHANAAGSHDAPLGVEQRGGREREQGSNCHRPGLSQACRRRTGAVTRNGLKPFAAVPPASNNSAGWPISVAVDHPSEGSGMTNTKRPHSSVSYARSAAMVTRSRQRCRLSSRAWHKVFIGPRRGSQTVGDSLVHDAVTLSRDVSLNTIGANEALPLRVDRPQVPAHGPTGIRQSRITKDVTA